MKQGALTAGASSKIPGLATVGRNPYLTKIRTSFSSLGKNSYRLMGQEAFQSTFSEILTNLLDSIILEINSGSNVNRERSIK